MYFNLSKNRREEGLRKTNPENISTVLKKR